MKNILLALFFALLISSCGKEKQNQDSPNIKITPISSAEEVCMNKLYDKLKPKFYSDIAKLSYDGLIECKLSKMQIITYIKKIKGVAHEE